MTKYIGINKGEDEYAAAVDTATTSKDVEIVVNTTNVPDRISLLNALASLRNAIIRKDYP